MFCSPLDIAMALTTRDIETPDTSARAAKSLEAISDSEMLGEKLTLNMGPSHPATHGVLRIVLELDGEIIISADPEVGYLHRGDEKIAENMQYNQFVPYTDRLDYLAPLANNVAYALAVEKLMGWELPPRGKAIRVLCCEIARISAHLLGIGAFAMDVGAMTVFLYTFTEREKLYDLNELDKLLTRNRIWVDRTKDLGVISKEDAISYGITGPNIRGSGVEYDVRKAQPYLDYQNYDFDIPIGTVGDAYDRYLIRFEEMRQSVKILHQAIEKLPEGPVMVQDPKNLPPDKPAVLMKMEQLIHHFIIHTEGVHAPPGEVYFGAENPKGELGFYVNSRGGGVPHRLKIRAPSFVNLSILPKILPGHMMSDVVAILGSLDFVMGESDR